jgi:murein DD-endopeptidase MepM/ murein hydrolase activator NlpD
VRTGALLSVLVLVASLWWRTHNPEASAHALLTLHRAPKPQALTADARPPSGSEPPSIPVPGAPAVTDADVERLRGRALLLPVEGYDRTQLHDGFRESRGDHVHGAIDLMAPRGTPVLAVEDGTIRKLFTSGRGGLSIYHFDPEGRYCYFYAHLDRYAPFLSEGKAVRKGDVIGYVGTTGNAPPNAPHLHFAILKLDGTGRWWEGTPINPYRMWGSALE